MGTLIVTCEICSKVIAQADKTSFSQDDINAYQLCSCSTDGTTDIQITVDGTVVYATPILVLTPAQEVEQQLFAAQNFGDSLIVQFATENALAGFTTDQLNSTLTQLTPVMTALNSGALSIAIQRVNALVPDGVVITTARIKQYRNYIESYLGVPLT
jgi:hypothetical protein